MLHSCYERSDVLPRRTASLARTCIGFPPFRYKAEDDKQKRNLPGLEAKPEAGAVRRASLYPPPARYQRVAQDWQGQIWAPTISSPIRSFLALHGQAFTCADIG